MKLYKLSAKMYAILPVILVYCSFRPTLILTLEQDSPKIQKFHFPSKLEVNEKTSVTCMLRRGQPPYVFRWFKDGKEIDNRREITIQTTKLLSNLVVDPVTHDAAGNYTCVVSSSAGSDSYSSTLTVTAAPSWIAEPTDAEAIAGNILTTVCSADGSPKPNVLWSKKGDASSPDQLIRSHLQNGSLLFSPIREEDDGEYLCIADNGIGEKLSKRIKIVVHDQGDNIPNFTFID